MIKLFVLLCVACCVVIGELRNLLKYFYGNMAGNSMFFEKKKQLVNINIRIIKNQVAHEKISQVNLVIRMKTINHF